jgi:hypothetical protein
MRIVSSKNNAMWMAILTHVLHRPGPGPAQCDEPEQQHASDQLAIDMMHPCVV